jgi:hypothetical protein
MSREELLQMLQEKGLDDNAIKALLKDTLDTLDADFADHDEKEDAEADEAGKLLGVDL